MNLKLLQTWKAFGRGQYLEFKPRRQWRNKFKKVSENCIRMLWFRVHTYVRQSLDLNLDMVGQILLTFCSFTHFLQATYWGSASINAFLIPPTSLPISLLPCNALTAQPVVTEHRGVTFKKDNSYKYVHCSNNQFYDGMKRKHSITLLNQVFMAYITKCSLKN
jgi:hypothetical protein